MRLWRYPLLFALGFAAVAATHFVRPPQPAEALAASEVVGIYQLRLRGDGWSRRADTSQYKRGRVRGAAEMRILRTNDTVNDGSFDVEIRLQGRLKDSLFSVVTPSPAFQGTGVLVGDTLAVIATGAPNFINAVNLRFVRRGRRVIGFWMTNFPAGTERLAFAGAAGVTFVGVRRRGQVGVSPGTQTGQSSATDAVSVDTR